MMLSIAPQNTLAVRKLHSATTPRCRRALFEFSAALMTVGVPSWSCDNLTRAQTLRIVPQNMLRFLRRYGA